MRAMSDSGCIDHPRCELYNYLLADFDRLGTWRGPQYEDWSADPVRLRNWWRQHGCVRCFLVAGRKRASGKWERVCREVGDGDYVMGNPAVVEEIKQAVTSWRSTKSRPADRFYCSKHTTASLCGCALFDRFLMASEWGHTGWVYGIPPVWRLEFQGRSWKIGEETIRPDDLTHLGGDESDMGATSSIAELEESLRGQGWQKWKQLKSADGNFEEAFLRSMTHRKAWFTPVSNNCNSAAYDVLTGFGADHMPQPGPDDGDRGYAIGHLFGTIDAPEIDLWPTDDSGVSGSGSWKKIVKLRTPPSLPAPPFRAPVSAEPARAYGCRPAPADAAELEVVEPRVEEPVEAEQAAAGPDMVYRLDTGRAVHLVVECPVMQKAKGEIESYYVQDRTDIKALQQLFNAPVCSTCLRLAEAQFSEGNHLAADEEVEPAASADPAPIADEPAETEEDPAAAGTDIVYRLDTGRAVHLIVNCPVMQRARGGIDSYYVPDKTDIEALQELFNAPVCSTCLRLVADDDSLGAEEAAPQKGPTISIFHLKTGRVLHLSEGCSALDNRTSELVEYDVSSSLDIQALQEMFEMGVCGNCLRSYDAEAHAIHSVRGKGADAKIFPDRLLVTTHPGAFYGNGSMAEVQLNRIGERWVKFPLPFTLPTLVLDYRRVLSQGDEGAERLEIRFDDEAKLNHFREKLEEAINALD